MNRFRADITMRDVERFRQLTRPANGPESPTMRARFTNQADSTVIDIYDEIGGWGITAADFIGQLRQVDTRQIELHINSGGGDVYDGLAIYNAILDHPATVNVQVDALAASAASFIAQAGDKVTMGRNSEMMIHDAIGMTIGNAAAHAEMVDLLNKASDNIASIYAARAGGSVKTWRSRMTNETWYSAQDAFDANLADAVAATPKRKMPPDGMPPHDEAKPALVNAALDTASPVHHTATVNGTWDSGPNVGRLPSPLSVATAKAMYGWYDSTQVTDGELPKSACKLPHHEVSADGSPGAANMNGVRNALARLPQSDIPEAEQDAVRRHLQAHMADAAPGNEADENEPAGETVEPDWSVLDEIDFETIEHRPAAIHTALLDAADESHLGIDTTDLRAVLAGEDWGYNPDAFAASIIDAVEAFESRPPDPEPEPEPELRLIDIGEVADALRRAFT